MARRKGRPRPETLAQPSRFGAKTIYVFWLMVFAFLTSMFVLRAMPPLTLKKAACVFVIVLTTSTILLEIYLAALEESMKSDWWKTVHQKDFKKRTGGVRRRLSVGPKGQATKDMNNSRKLFDNVAGHGQRAW